MANIKVCLFCLQGYADTTLRYCLEDGSALSGVIGVPLPENDDEIETVLRPRIESEDKPKRRKTNPKEFLAKHFPDLLNSKRRTSRLWESSENASYHDNWWFNFSLADLEKTDFIIFVGALDYEDKAFTVFRVPTAFLMENLSKMDVTGEGWVNLYVHMKDHVDLRHPSGLSFSDFVIDY